MAIEEHAEWYMQDQESSFTVQVVEQLFSLHSAEPSPCRRQMTCFSMVRRMRAAALDRLEDLRGSRLEDGGVSGGSPTLAAEFDLLHISCLVSTAEEFAGQAQPRHFFGKAVFKVRQAVSYITVH